MFTQCPSCSTVYEVHAADLTVAQGKVRCGVCATTFNSLSYLTEDAPAHAATLTGLTAADLADLAAADGAPPDACEALQQQDAPADAGGAADVATEFARAAEADAAGSDAATAQVSEAPTADTADASPPPHEDADASVAATEDTPGSASGASPQVAAGEVPEAGSARVAEEDVATDAESLFATPRPRARGAWAAAAALLVVALAAQAVHYGRAQIVQQPRLGPALQRVYRALGVDVQPDWDVTRYEIVRRPEMASAGPASADVPGTLRLIAVFANGAERPQPYPLLRLTLEDRWGGAVARRDFEPREYLHGTRAQMLSPGEQARAELVLVDPGVESVGYTLDLCLHEDGVVRCANDES
jgi:predicted Zn finger-like uncharacterized protein